MKHIGKNITSKGTFAKGQVPKLREQAHNWNYLQRQKKVVLEERGEAMVAQRCDGGSQLGIQTAAGDILIKERVGELAEVGPVL